MAGGNDAEGNDGSEERLVSRARFARFSFLATSPEEARACRYIGGKSNRRAQAEGTNYATATGVGETPFSRFVMTKRREAMARDDKNRQMGVETEELYFDDDDE